MLAARRTFPKAKLLWRTMHPGFKVRKGGEGEEKMGLGFKAMREGRWGGEGERERERELEAEEGRERGRGREEESEEEVTLQGEEHGGRG